jgi:hypothetical protein
VKAIDTLTNAVGLYAVTLDGELGIVREGNRFVAEPALAQAFGPQIRQLLKTYLGNPDGSDVRLGLVFHSLEELPWRSDTLVIEEHVLREVYPVGGPATQELTAFQKKNRVKSLYRGIELLIEYRHERLADAPVYCPLLFDRDTSLADYPAYRGFEGGAKMPVVEVVNLTAMLPLGRRNTPALLAMMQDMHSYVRKDMRRDDFLSLRQDGYVGSKGDAATVEYVGADKRHERQQSFPAGSLGERLTAAEQVQRSERFDQVEQWLERPHRPVDAELLRGFVQFRNLDAAVLAALAARALVHTAPRGVRLLDIGMTDLWNMYLLEGTVSLQAEDGGALLVAGGTDKAASPISFLKPRKYAVSSVTPVSFLWMHDALLQAVAGAPDTGAQSESVRNPFRS